MIQPGKTIGILGGGQLGRMTGQAARSLGYNFVVFEPSPNCPASQVADEQIAAEYTDEEAIKAFTSTVDLVTYEFENVDTAALKAIGDRVPIFPRQEVLYTCQHREREKRFLKSNGFPHAAFEVVDSAESLKSAVSKIGTPCVLKTAAFGYDGKGQQKISSPDADLDAVWQTFEGRRAVLEAWVPFEKEISVMVAIGADGSSSVFPVAENIHTNHILDFSIVPARVAPETLKAAESLARDIASKIGLVGLLGVEMFVLADGSIAVNELAPRPHNSAHYSLDACLTSQFEQFVRAVAGLPLGSTELLKPVVMVNILGDAWENGEPDFTRILREPKAKLHLYGKSSARVGRKMGHFCVLDDSVDQALELAKSLKQKLFS